MKMKFFGITTLAFIAIGILLAQGTTNKKLATLSVDNVEQTEMKKQSATISATADQGNLVPVSENGVNSKQVNINRLKEYVSAQVEKAQQKAPQDLATLIERMQGSAQLVSALRRHEILQKQIANDLARLRELQAMQNQNAMKDQRETISSHEEIKQLDMKLKSKTKRLNDSYAELMQRLNEEIPEILKKQL